MADESTEGPPFSRRAAFLLRARAAGHVLPPQFLDFSDHRLSLHWAIRYRLSYRVELEHQ